VTTMPGPREEETSGFRHSSVPDFGGAPSHHGVANPHDIENRLEDVVRVILEYAALRFDARAQFGPDGDVVDAVAAGVNFLGEELEAAYEELESRVAVRTAELTKATEELTYRALHDQLTGLANRTLFWDRLSHRLRQAGRRPIGFAVLFLDLDNFKAVNDTLGHAAGDRLLVVAAERIRAELREGDTAGRVGGDEFVVLLDAVPSAQVALNTAHRLGETLRAPYEIGSKSWTTKASIGVAVGPANFETADGAVAAADAAMYDAKRRGPGGCVAYRTDRHVHTGNHRPITGDDSVDP